MLVTAAVVVLGNCAVENCLFGFPSPVVKVKWSSSWLAECQFTQQQQKIKKVEKRKGRWVHLICTLVVLSPSCISTFAAVCLRFPIDLDHWILPVWLTQEMMTHQHWLTSALLSLYFVHCRAEDKFKSDWLAPSGETRLINGGKNSGGGGFTGRSTVASNSIGQMSMAMLATVFKSPPPPSSFFSSPLGVPPRPKVGNQEVCAPAAYCWLPWRLPRFIICGHCCTLTDCLSVDSLSVSDSPSLSLSLTLSLSLCVRATADDRQTKLTNHHHHAVFSAVCTNHVCVDFYTADALFKERGEKERERERSDWWSSHLLFKAGTVLLFIESPSLSLSLHLWCTRTCSDKQ